MLDEVAASSTEVEIPKILATLKETRRMGITVILVERLMKVMVNAVYHHRGDANGGRSYPRYHCRGLVFPVGSVRWLQLLNSGRHTGRNHVIVAPGHCWRITPLPILPLPDPMDQSAVNP